MEKLNGSIVHDCSLRNVKKINVRNVMNYVHHGDNNIVYTVMV